MDSGSKQGSQQYAKWVFTLPKDQVVIPHETDSSAPTAPRNRMVSSLLASISKEYYFQLERAPSTGMLHYQGCFNLKERLVLTTLKNQAGFLALHLEVCKDWQTSIAYCSKVETRVDGPWSHLVPPIEPYNDALMKADFFDWQQQVYDMLMGKPDNRTVMWICDLKGGRGKTAFTLHMMDNHQAAIFNTGKDSDIAHSYNNERIVLFDYMRSRIHVSYQTLEAMKNGYLFSGKYGTARKRFHSPHVFCFANWWPNFKEMSLDRWRLFELDDSGLVQRDTSEVMGEEEQTLHSANMSATNAQFPAYQPRADDQ